MARACGRRAAQAELAEDPRPADDRQERADPEDGRLDDRHQDRHQAELHVRPPLLTPASLVHGVDDRRVEASRPTRAGRAGRPSEQRARRGAISGPGRIWSSTIFQVTSSGKSSRSVASSWTTVRSPSPPPPTCRVRSGRSWTIVGSRRMPRNGTASEHGVEGDGRGPGHHLVVVHRPPGPGGQLAGGDAAEAEGLAEPQGGNTGRRLPSRFASGFGAGRSDRVGRIEGLVKHPACQGARGLAWRSLRPGENRGGPDPNPDERRSDDETLPNRGTGSDGRRSGDGRRLRRTAPPGGGFC